LREILANLKPFKENCTKTADVLNWQNESKALILLYNAIDS
jgi:hypothetical protein